MIPLRIDSSFTPGRYCCFTGRSVRPWHVRLLYAVLHVATTLALLAYALELAEDHLPAASASTAGLALAAIYALSVFAPRLHALTLLGAGALAVRAAISAWGEQAPLDLTQLPALGDELAAGLASSDAFLAQAARTNTFALAAAVHALVIVIPLAALALGVVRSWNLPRRLWFARYHPVWRRPYAIGDSPHPLLGVLAVERDPLLAQKLVWLRVDRASDALRIGARGPEERADAPRVPLAEQLGDVVLFREGRQWHVSGNLPGGGHAELRSLLVPLHPAGVKGLGARRYVDVAELPVRDLFADQNALYGKRPAAEHGARLFGLLVDSRPNAETDGPALPRFCVLLERDGALEVEYGHPDLIRQVPGEVDGDVARLVWRERSGGHQVFEFERGTDSIHRVLAEDEDYHLLFVAFGARA